MVLGIALLAEQVTSLQGVGYGLSVAAFFVYQRIKVRQLASDSAARGGAALPAPGATASVVVSAASHALGSNGSSGALPRYHALPIVEVQRERSREGSQPGSPSKQ